MSYKTFEVSCHTPTIFQKAALALPVVHIRWRCGHRFIENQSKLSYFQELFRAISEQGQPIIFIHSDHIE